MAGFSEEDLVQATMERQSALIRELPEMSLPVAQNKELYSGRSNKNLCMLIAISFPDRDEKIWVCKRATKREIRTTKELTVAEAEAILYLAEAWKRLLDSKRDRKGAESAG